VFDATSMENRHRKRGWNILQFQTQEDPNFMAIDNSRFKNVKQNIIY
jgi:hypothetical protein